MTPAGTSTRMPGALFVSDVHVKRPDCPRAELFTAFLGALDGRNTNRLFLLGDIFDLWVADHRWFIDRYRKIIGELERLKREGVEIHYFEGNHDLHLRYFFGDRLGLRVHDGPYTLELGGRTVRLEHGDEMDPDDRGYLFLRWFLRTPPVRLLIRHLPGTLIARLGNRASRMSRAYVTANKSMTEEKAIATIHTHAKRVARQEPFDLIVSGHVHVRDDSVLREGDRSFRSVNLGSWFDAPCCFRIDDETAQFHELTNDSFRQAAPRERRRAASR